MDQVIFYPGGIGRDPEKINSEKSTVHSKFCALKTCGKPAKSGGFSDYGALKTRGADVGLQTFSLIFLPPKNGHEALWDKEFSKNLPPKTSAEAGRVTP